METAKKSNVKQEINIKKIEIFLKKQEENDRKTEHTNIKGRHV